MNTMEVGLKARAKALETIAKVKDGTLREGGVWTEEASKKSVREMITTADLAPEFIEKTTLEIYNGRELVPLVYTEIYETITNRAFPRKVTVKPRAWASCVFLEKLEGEEIKFGTLNPADEITVPIITYAAGFQVTEDVIEYDELYQIDEDARAMGESYNKKLNDVHMKPIIDGVYTNTAGTPAVRKKVMVGKPGQPGIAQFVDFDTNLRTTLVKAFKILAGGTDFRILVNSSDRIYLEDEIEGMVLANSTIPTVVKKLITLDKFIIYDGDEVYVGEDTYTYVGVPDDYIYIVYPRIQFRTYMKHDLIIDTGNEDLSRLIEAQRVGRARLGVLVQLGGRRGAMKVKIR